MQTWVNYVKDIPLPSDFNTTDGYGPAICVNEKTLQAYGISSNGAVIPFQGLFVTPQPFGALGDNSNNDGPAFAAAVQYLFDHAVNASALHKASARLFIPAGGYYLGNTTLDFNHTLIIEGEAGLRVGLTGAAASQLRWDANTTGMRFQAYNTSGASTVDVVNHTDSANSLIRNLALFGGFVDGSTPEGEFHGIHIKATIAAEHVSVEAFQGDGFHAWTTSGAGDSTEGYSNASRLYDCSAANCRAGLFIAGADGNVWWNAGFQAHYNRTCGIDDQSFLGNTHIAPHTNGNGTNGFNDGTAAFPAYVVSYSGNLYCVVQGQEVGASTNPPSGTTADNTWWYYMRPGAPAAGTPAWFNGMHLRCGAPYRTNNFNADNLFLNAYEEGNQGFSQFVAPTLSIGGLKGGGEPKGLGTDTFAYQGYFGSRNGFAAINKATGFGNVLDPLMLTLGRPDGGDSRQTLWYQNDLILTRLQSLSPTIWPFRITGTGTSSNLGPDKVNFDNGFGIADQKRLPAASMPISGSWIIGDFIENTSRSVLGSPGSHYVLLGWDRITTGSGNVLNTDWVERRALTGT